MLQVFTPTLRNTREEDWLSLALVTPTGDTARTLKYIADQALAALALAQSLKREVVTETETSRENTADDKDNWVRWSNSEPKAYVIQPDVASAGDFWKGNVVTGSDLTISADDGMTVNGAGTIAAGTGYTLVFVSPTLADLVKGA